MFYLPTALIHYIPFVNNVRVITRIFVLFSLLFPIVVLWYFNNSIKKQTVTAISIALLVVLFIEFKPYPYQTIDKQSIPKEVYELKPMKGDVVLPIPAGLRDGFTQIGLNNSDMLYFQTIFDKKMIGGYTARLSSKVKQLYLIDPVMRDILKLSENPNQELPKPTPQQVDAFFAAFAPDIIFIHPKYRATAAERYIFEIAGRKGFRLANAGEYLIMTRH